MSPETGILAVATPQTPVLGAEVGRPTGHMSMHTLMKRSRKIVNGNAWAYKHWNFYAC